MPRALFRLAAAALLLGTTGCFIPFAYPRLDTAPPVRFEPVEEPIHAFRVDVTEHCNSVWMTERSERLARIDLDQADMTPLLVRASITYGCFAFPIIGNPLQYYTRSVRLRLYRPGYQMVEIGGNAEASAVVWKRSADDGAEMHELDAIFPFHSLASGSESAEHQAALAFGAAEYNRLAAHASTPALKEMATKAARRLTKIAEAADPDPPYKLDQMHPGFSDGLGAGQAQGGPEAAEAVPLNGPRPRIVQ